MKSLIHMNIQSLCFHIAKCGQVHPVLLSSRGWSGLMNAAKYAEILEEKLLKSVCNLRHVPSNLSETERIRQEGRL